KVPDANPSPALAARWAAAVAALPTPGTPEEEAQAIGALSRLAATAGDAALAEQARRRRGALAARADLSPMALYGLGSVAEKEKDFPVAVALYERAIAGAAARGANFAVAKNNLAMVLADMPGGDVQRAAMFAADALRVEPGQPGYLDTLAHVQEVAGDRRAAERSLRAAIQADPENVQWLVRLAELYRAETPARAADVQAAFDQIKMLTLRNGANRSLGARIDAIRAWLEAVAAVPLKP
ncbi:MAG TPA: hypothetical protein VK986_23800, partial [Tepidisphaeraceae bacterium]|nr:hypothetical protein [Tepidisphaeraceae bacterium]